MREGWYQTESGALEYRTEDQGEAVGQAAFSRRIVGWWVYYALAGIYTALMAYGAIAISVSAALGHIKPHPDEIPTPLAVVFIAAFWTVIALPTYRIGRIRVTLDGTDLEVVNFARRHHIDIMAIEIIAFDGIRAVVHCHDGRRIGISAIRARVTPAHGVEPLDAPDRTKVLDRCVEIAQQRSLGETGPSRRPGPSGEPEPAVRRSIPAVMRLILVGPSLGIILAISVRPKDHGHAGLAALTGAMVASALLFYGTLVVARRRQPTGPIVLGVAMLVPWIVVNVAMLAAFFAYFVV